MFKKLALSIVVGIIISAYFTYPLITSFKHHYMDNPDFYLNAWAFWDTSQSIRTGEFLNVKEFFNERQFYPFPSTLAQRDFMALPSLLLYTPAYLVSKSHIFGVNFTLFSSYVLNFVFCFWCLKYLSKNAASSFLGAMIFSFSPNVIQLHEGHFEYLNRFLIPPFFVLLLRFFNFPKAKNAIILFFVYFLLWFTSIQLAVFTTLFGLFAFCIYFLLQFSKRRLAKNWLAKIILHSMWFLAFAPILIYFFQPYLTFSLKENFRRPLISAEYFAAKPIDFFIPFPNNYLFGKLAKMVEPKRMVANETQFNYTERTLLPGYTVLILLIFFVLRKIGYPGKLKDRIFKMSEWVVYLSTLGFGIVLAFGPYLHLGNLTVKLPYYYIYNIFPLLAATRTPTRIQYVWLFFIAYLITQGLSNFLAKRTKRVAVVLLLLLLLLLVAEYTTRFRWGKYKEVPLPFDPKDSKVLFLPIRGVQEPINDSSYLIHLTKYDFTMINGHNGSERNLEHFIYLTDTLRALSFTSSWFNVLNTLDIDYIIIDKMALDSSDLYHAKIINSLPEYQNLIVFDDENFSVIKVDNYKGSLNTTCKNIFTSDINLKFETTRNKEDNTIILFYEGENNLPCNMAFIYHDRYVKVDYEFVSPSKKGSAYFRLPPFLLSHDKFSGSVVLARNMLRYPKKVELDASH
jgi:hypothetical protein